MLGYVVEVADEHELILIVQLIHYLMLGNYYLSIIMLTGNFVVKKFYVELV